MKKLLVLIAIFLFAMILAAPSWDDILDFRDLKARQDVSRFPLECLQMAEGNYLLCKKDGEQVRYREWGSCP